MIQLQNATKSTSSSTSNRSKKKRKEKKRISYEDRKPTQTAFSFNYLSIYCTSHQPANVCGGWCVLYCSSDLLQFDRRLITFLVAFPKWAGETQSTRTHVCTYSLCYFFYFFILLLLYFDSPIFTIRARTQRMTLFFCGFFFLIHLLFSFSILDLWFFTFKVFFLRCACVCGEVIVPNLVLDSVVFVQFAVFNTDANRTICQCETSI